MLRWIKGRRAAGALALALALGAAACSTTAESSGQSVTSNAAQPAPTGTATTSSPSSPPQAITIAFGGDTHFEGVLGSRLAADPDTALGPVASVLSSADLAMVNLETAITTRGTPEPKSFTFRAPPTAFQALRAAGVDVTTMANNHGMDFGLVGLQDSVAAIKASRFPVVGIGLDDAQAYAPYYTTVKGVRVAFVGATQVLDDPLIPKWTAGPGKPGLASAKNVDRTVRAVREAREHADVVVVYLHYGTETVNCPTDSQQAIAKTLSDAGADILVGSHAHVLLGAGFLGHTYVDYGLGNFAFYSSGSGPNTQSGVLMVRVQPHKVLRAGWVPAHIEGGVPVPLQGGAAGAAQARWESLRGCTHLAATPAG
jgi:poly-gamma-glutamate capsule biosynthesis protein CapA/YwtB (metallophosphatase superfamily)